MILKEQASAGGGTLASSALVPSWEKHLVPSPPTSAGPLSLLPPRLTILLTQGPEDGWSPVEVLGSQG